MKIDYGQIVRDAWAITKKNRWLWVFGMLVAMFTSSFSGGGSSGGTSKDLNLNNQANTSGPINKVNSPTDVLKEFEKTTDPQKVLGAATSSLEGFIKDISPLYVGLFVALFITSSIFSAGIMLYVKSWSVGSLLAGVDSERSGTSLNLKQMSDSGKTKAIQILKLNLIPNLGIWAIFGIPMVVLLALSLGGLFKEDLSTNIAGILIPGLSFIGLLLILLLCSLLVSIAVNFGTYFITLENAPWKVAFKEGYRFVLSNFIPTLIVTVVNIVAGFVSGLIILVALVPVLIIGAGLGVGAMAVPYILIGAAPIGLLLFIAFAIIASLIRGIYTVFEQSTWVILFRTIRGGQNGGN